MHLFKNKTKDVKQFLEEMKANKTNRSSNASTLEKKLNRPPQLVSPEPYRTEYHNSTVGHQRNSQYENHPRITSSNFSNHDSNSTFRDSVSSSRPINSMHSVGHNFIPATSQHQMSHHPQRVPSQEQNFYKAPQAVYSKPPHFQEPDRLTNFEPNSQQNYNDFQSTYPNRNQKFYQPTKSHAQYQKTVSQPFNPYQSEVQQPYFQNNFQIGRNFNEFTEDRRTNQATSQRSHSSSYEKAEFYQNSNSIRPQSRPPQSLITQLKPPKVQKLAENQSFKAHQAKNSQSRSNTQFDTRSQRLDFQPSQPPLHKLNSQRLYTSQMGQTKLQMDEISQADDCFSTQNDSPTKLTDFLSKTKFDIVEIQETGRSQEIQEHILMEVEQQNNEKSFIKKEKIPEKKREETPELKSANRSLTPIKKISSVLKNLSPTKHFNNSPIKKQSLSPAKQCTSVKTKPKQSQIKVSQNQRYRLQKSLHQIDQVHIKIDSILKETSIIFSNIKRSNSEFRKMIERNGVIDKRNRMREQSNRMEIEGEEIKMNARVVPTDKKARQQKIEKTIETEMNEKQTYKKAKANTYKEIEI